MNKKFYLDTVASWAVALLSISFALILIAPIYYHVPHVITPEVIEFYRALNADMNDIARISLNLYQQSYLLMGPVFIASGLLIYRGHKGGAGLLSLIFLLCTLALCVLWREFVEFGLNRIFYETLTFLLR